MVNISPVIEECGNKSTMTNCQVENLYYDMKTLTNLFFKEPHNAKMELKPSVYLEEMSLSFEERIDSLSTIQHRKVNFPGYVPSKYFTINPPFILIQSFTCGKPYTVTLELKCTAKAMKSLTLVSDRDPVLTVECTSKLMTRIAPGMSVKYKVTFLPVKVVDYYHQILFETDGENFKIPILALKPRPLLDFPDHIQIPPTPVKITGHKTFVLRNIGSVEAVFTLECSNGLFMVEPEKVKLQPGNLITITLKMFSVIVGVFTSSMKVVLETGEVLSISVEASTVNSSVSIDEKRLTLPEVFMTLRERRTIQLVNNSDNLVQFSWQKHSSLQEDLQELERLKQQMKGVEELESVRCNVLEYNGIINAELHSSIYKRIYTDEIMLLGSDNLLFQHENFKIVPLSGEVWPGSSIEIMVIFEANTPLTAKCRAYCECTGIEDRLELVVEGRSIGPDLKINLSVLNISKVPLSAEKTFEILAKNCGDIPGNLEYVENEKVSKAKISCKPRKLYLLPGETKAFFINLCSISRGEFMEELKFVILESKEEIDFVVLGEVLRPNIFFDKNEINFGNVPLGFPIIEIVHLKNNSLVAIPFSMSVPQDGFEPALTCESFSQSKRKFYLPQSPQEFIIKPSSGEIGAGETKQIKIIFTPNKYRVLAASLVLELNVNTEAETSSVKLSANAISPMIVVLPEVIKSPFCFINYEYRQTLTLRNISSAPGYFHIMPQVITASTGLLYHISEEEVMIDGLEVIEIELTWIVTQVGKHVEIVKMMLFGEQKAEVLCELQCSGQGPMVTLIPNELHFGRLQLLTYQAQAVELINDSPIDAHFAAVEGEKDQFFVEIDPECGVLEANSRVRLTVGIRLYDSGNVTQNILINIKNGRQLVLCINAKGHGSSIVITPSISPVYNLGKLASNKHYTIPLRTTNHSTKLHTLYWSKDMKCKLMPHHEDSTEWKNFKIDPCKIDIPPHKSSIVNLHVFSESEGEINEHFYVFAAIDNKGARFLLNKVLLKVEFINRGLELSKSSLHFRIDITPDRRTLMNQTQTIIANNNTDLTILCKFQVKRPFLILDHQKFGCEDRIIHFGKNSSQPIDIIFSPATSLNSISTVFKGTLRVSYRDVEEFISLSGEINYPNLELSRREIHFGTVPPFSSRSCDVELINDGVLTAFYFWEVTVKSENILPCLIDGELIRNSSVMDCKPSFCSFTSEDSTSDSQVLNISPSFGQIEGYKNLRTTFTFFPCFMKSYIIEASCHVIGGRCQPVTIFGGSAQVQYSLEPRHVDFGFRSFNDMHRQNITITNLCEMELHVTANKNLVEHSDALLNSGLFVVSPTFQKIAGLSSATIQVTYYPRICQELKDEFIIQVNTANPILVEVKGYGTLPQVIISNPCKSIVDHDIPIATFYPAISWLTSPMFDSLWRKTSRLDLESQQRSIDHDFSDWVLITNEDEYPTVEDIDLALQRMLTYIHLLENGLLDSKNSVISRTRPYLELPTPSPEYVVDFGKVVVDSVVDQNILIKNANMLEACPQVSVILPFSARALKDSYNVVLTFIKNSKSKAGVNILNVKLKPIRMTYSSKVTYLNLNVFVVVKGGLKIPMKISAVITIPFLTAVTKNLNFMEILVGEEKILSLQIKNEGFVSCEWTASLKFMHRPSAKSNPFSLKSSYSGYLEPSEDHIVEVSFRPEFKGKYDYSLIFEVKQNSEPIKINLQGCAIEPNLHITNNNLTFPTVFPNVEDNSKTFTVENRSSFPVEVYFPDYDRFCREEESAIRLLCTIYSTDHLPLLPNQYGTSLNTKLLNSLQHFLDKMRVFLSTLLKERGVNHNLSNEKNNSLGGNVRTEHDQSNDEIVKMPEISIEEKLLAELEKITGQFSQKCDFETLELENLLKDFISLNEETFHEFLAEHDPLQIIEQEKIDMIKSSTENLMSCPCLIIFHGAPKTDFQYWANKTARLLKMPAKSIDRIIVDALISGLTPAARSVKLTIEEYYSNNFESETVELDLEHVPFSMVPDSDPYYELTRKIDALIWLKNRITNSQANKRAKSTSPASTPKTKSRQKTAPKFPTDWHDSLLNISLSLLREIILESINRDEKGLVIETLANKFIEDPLKALTVLLSCCNVQNPLHFVSLFADYKTWKSNSGSIEKETMRPTDNPVQPTTPQLTKQSTPSSARKEKKKTSSSKSSKKQKLHSDDDKHSTEEVLLEAGFKNYGIELSSFLFLLGSWVPMINPQDGFEKKFNNVLSIVRKVFPNKDGKKSDSQKQTKSTSKEQGKFKFSVGLSNSDATSPGVDVWIFDFRKNHLNNITNFIRIIKLMEKKIDEEGPCKPENPFCKDTSYLIMKKPAIRQLHDHTDKGFSLISERHSLSKNEELASISPSISESLKNSEEISVKRLKGLESKFKKSKKKSNAGKKKGRKSVEPFSGSSDLTSDLLPSSDPTNASCQIVRKESTLISRVLLEPGTTHTWQIVFEPQNIGHYKDAYDLQVARGRKLYQIKCSGKCDFPSVNFDPAVVFSEVAESYGKSKNKNKIFLKDIETFRFGSLFVKPDCGSETREANTTAATLRFVNDSELDVEMDLAFNEESEYTNQTFSFAPSKLFISRSSHKHVSVWAHPVVAGEHGATLICSIKENPQIHSIKLSCSGVIPDVEFLPPVLTSSHVLIGKKSIHNLNIINKCDLPMIFEVTDVASLVKGLFITPANGVVKERAEEVVAFEYTSSKVEVVQKQVEFKFFEDEPAKTLLLSKSINFHVECYEVSVDVIFPKKGISSVDFGIMKIDERNDRAFSLKNKGKFGIGFEIDVIKVPGLNIHPKEFLSVEPKSGTILSGKMINLKVICSCSAPVIIVDSPAIRIRIMESHSTGSEASVISIPVTVKSYYSSFKISPNVAINFGPILSDSEREMQLQIENTGLFDFKYAVLNPQLVNNTNPDFFEPQKKITPKSKKDKASSKKSSSAKTKSKPEHLEIEPFIIRDSCGTVKPGSVASMKVICKNPRLGDCVTDVLIKISGSDHPDGVTYKLLAYGCSPQVDISNLDAIFHEAHLQDEFQPNSFETVLEPKIIFSKRDLVLVFYNTLVGVTANINVHFSNTDRLPCDLSFKVTSSTDIACFTVHPIVETIGPLSSKLFTISFNPKKFEIVSGEAVITTGKKVLKIKLIGEGVLPQLEIVKPLSASRNNVIIPFEPTLLSYSTVKAFTLRNVGKIRCKVVIEELESESKVFHWRMIPEIHHSEQGFEGLLDKIEADMKSIILLNPLEERDFEVEFLPDTIDSFTCKLKLLLVNNPYESYSITMIGSGYQDDVIMRDVTRIDSKESADLLKSLKFVEVPESKFLAAYAAEYGAVYLGQCKEKSFQICNLSNDFHRFEWEDVGNVTVSPKSGLVYPNCCEEICMTFHSEEPITPLFKMPVVCSFMRVELHSDDVLKESSFESTSLSKDCDDDILLEPMGGAVEPEYTVIEDACQQIVVIAAGVVDNPVPFCQINSITFPETLLFQVSGRTFDVTNNSFVPLSFEWRFKDASSDRLEERKLSGSAVAPRVSFGTTQPRFNNILNEITGPRICRRKNTVKPNTAHNRYCSAKPLPSSVSLMKRPSTAVAVHSKESPNFSDAPIQYNKHPFSISSMSGIIQANETVSFEVSFAPVVRGFHSLLLHLRVKGLLTACEQLQIDLSGSGVSPVCHLLVATSDCLAAGRHRSCLSLQPHCKVIEFEVLGSTNPVTKSFDIVNTTGNPYWFTLKQVAPLNSPFSCLTPDGEIEPFKQITLSFVLFPQESGTFESLWHLEIPNLDVMQPFLIVGKAREPSVSLSSSHVYMQHTFVGVPVSCTVSLFNNENVDLNFKIFGPKDTIRPKQFGDGDKHLKVKPASGFIKAHSQIELICTIIPDKPGEDVVLLKCQVERCREPLLLHVHTCSFNVHPRISYVTFHNTIEELSPYAQNRINLNKLTPRIPSSIQFTIANLGKLPITYRCGSNKEECRLARTEVYWNKKHDTVAYRDEHTIELSVIALSKIAFKDLPVIIQVDKGPMYRILVSGSAESAFYEFSFKEYDFRHCLIDAQGSSNAHTANLNVTNKDEDRIFIEVVSPPSENFKVFVPNDGVLKPRESFPIRLSFLPVEPKFYSAAIEFLINGVDRHKVVLSGEGHHMQISLVDPHQKSIDFGSVLIGREVKKVLTLVNNSKVSGEMSLIPSEGMEPPFTLEPSTKQTIGPHGRKEFILNFTPNEIVPFFSVQLLLSYGGKSEPICLVKGKAMGSKISSDREFVTFGCVVLGCTSSVKLVVHNEGDIGSHFNWEHTMPKSWFKITPNSGFLPGKSSNTFLMTFSPEEVIGFMQKQVSCYFDTKYEIKPLLITVTGSCVSAPPPTDILNFNVSVRKQQIKSIDLRNPTEDVWAISPLFSGDFFRGSKQILIDPYDSKSYDIIYEPLTMTSEQKKHEGTVFFPFLDGSCKLYQLIGSAGKPEAESSLEWNMPCKTNTVKSLLLKNWLPFLQSFRKEIKLVKSSIAEPICTMDSNPLTEVGSLQKRPYTMNIFCYQECSVQYEIAFHNDTSSEYIWYSVSIRFEPCPVLERFSLTTKVRQDVYLDITLVRKLPCPASFRLAEAIDSIHIEPVSFNAGDEARIAVRYFPLFIENERTCTLKIHSPELGEFVYSLILSANEPLSEEAVTITTEIGSCVKLSLPVMNHSNETCTFSYKSSHPYFKCEKDVVAKPGQKVDLQMEFEPSCIGKIKTQLEISSKSAGIFRFPVTAYCTKPAPKGPLFISSNKNTLVLVKNVFGSRQAFTWTIDNENFIVRTSKQNIKPSEHLELAIGLKIQNEQTVKNIHPQIPITGKLVISCEELGIDWIFYLRNGNEE